MRSAYVTKQAHPLPQWRGIPNNQTFSSSMKGNSKTVNHKMKKYYIAFALFAASVAFSACGGDNDDDNNNVNTNQPTPVKKPTDWVLPQGMHYNSMSVTIDQDAVPNGVTVTMDDLLGAFVDNECRGVASPVKDIDGKYRFSLVIHAMESDVNRDNLQVELKYYSAQKAYIYTSAKFPFERNGILGSFEHSFVPSW